MGDARKIGKRYFTSDQHFFDKNIMAAADRPYATPEEMTDDIVARFLAKTADASEIYILGDIFGGAQPADPYRSCGEMLERLGARSRPFHLIRGNHDHLSDEEYLALGFKSVNRIDFIELGGMRAMLTHDPCMVQAKNLLAICGHIHTLFYEVYQEERNTLAVNVGVDLRNFAPVSEDEILEIVGLSPYKLGRKICAPWFV